MRRALEKSNEDTLKVKLGTAIGPTDDHAIDIQYHLKCWNTHVSNILRRNNAGTDNSIPIIICKHAASRQVMWVQIFSLAWLFTAVLVFW